MATHTSVHLCSVGLALGDFYSVIYEIFYGLCFFRSESVIDFSCSVVFTIIKCKTQLDSIISFCFKIVGIAKYIYLSKKCSLKLCSIK